MQLAQNVRQALKDFPEIKIHADQDRMHLLLNGADGQLVIPKLAKIFGIKISLKYSCRKRCRSFETSCSRHHEKKFILGKKHLKLSLKEAITNLN